MATAYAMQFVGDFTAGIAHTEGLQTARLFNVAGHALVGCGSSVARGESCGSGAAAGAIGSVASALTVGMEQTQALVVHSVAGGLASTAAGGSFANGAVTAAFGYLFNEMGTHAQRGYEPTAYPGGMICNSPDGPGCVQAGATALSIFDDPILAIFGGVSFKGANVATRALTEADLGVGVLTQLRGTFSVTDGVARVWIDMIEGNIRNPFGIVRNLEGLARANGAAVLNIEGRLAYPDLADVLVRRYGMTTMPGNFERITRTLK
jgi:hypothetical protein